MTERTRPVHMPTLLVGLLVLGLVGCGLGGVIGWLVTDAAVSLDAAAAMDGAKTGNDSLDPAVGLVAGGATFLLDMLFSLGGALVFAGVGGASGLVAATVLALRRGAREGADPEEHEHAS